MFFSCNILDINVFLRDRSITVDENITVGESNLCVQVELTSGETLERNMTVSVGTIQVTACKYESQ